jgi:hypothetical protein
MNQTLNQQQIQAMRGLDTSLDGGEFLGYQDYDARRLNSTFDSRSLNLGMTNDDLPPFFNHEVDAGDNFLNNSVRISNPSVQLIDASHVPLAQRRLNPDLSKKTTTKTPVVAPTSAVTKPAKSKLGTASSAATAKK